MGQNRETEPIRKDQFAKAGAMRPARAVIVLIAASISAVPATLAEDAAPANTLIDLQRQFGACMGGESLGPPVRG